MASSSPPPLNRTGEEETGRAATVQAPQERRRKGMGTRVWLTVSESGQLHVEEIGKHRIMRRTGLPARDLRVLNPVLSCPSSILSRERAIVVNLEHIKAIITAKEVLIINTDSPLVYQFIQDLQRRVSSSDCASQQEVDGKTLPASGDHKILPFEFRALESCLESACQCLESETKTLEEGAYPALDKLTSKISTFNLDCVRQIKSRLVAISSRARKVRDELEHLLDDNNDIADMYLTEKLLARSLDNASIREEVDKVAPKVDDKRAEDCIREDESNSQVFTRCKPNIEELEMLLEAYFVQIDGILQRLSDVYIYVVSLHPLPTMMNDYVDATEDCINITLDDKQNQLLQMGVMLSTANMILNVGIMVVGLLSTNINIKPSNPHPIKYWGTAIGVIGGCVVLYLIALGWGTKRRLLAL